MSGDDYLVGWMFGFMTVVYGFLLTIGLGVEYQVSSSSAIAINAAVLAFSLVGSVIGYMMADEVV